MVLDDPVRGLVKRRTVWLAVTVIGVTVFLFFAAGTTYSLLAPDYVFEDGELPGEAAILACSLALAAFGGHRQRVADRLLGAAASEHGFGAWLPPSDAADRDRRIDFAAETVRVRRIARRAAALTLVWAALAGSGVTGMVLLDQAAADLLATGTRVDGVVLAIHDPARGVPSMQVRYGTRIVEIVRDSGHDYHVGEAVTVVQDRADPERVRTTEEKNENQVLFGLCVVVLLIGLAGVPFAVGTALGWRRRARAVAATGWRVATVDVVSDRSPGRSRYTPDLRVRYREGTGIVLRAALSTHGAKAMASHPDRRAWIGGWGKEMVVLFPHGPRRPGPYAVPVYATALRDVSRFRR
jgi:hypothetical protein